MAVHCKYGLYKTRWEFVFCFNWFAISIDKRDMRALFISVDVHRIHAHTLQNSIKCSDNCRHPINVYCVNNIKTPRIIYAYAHLCRATNIQFHSTQKIVFGVLSIQTGAFHTSKETVNHKKLLFNWVALNAFEWIRYGCAATNTRLFSSLQAISVGWWRGTGETCRHMNEGINAIWSKQHLVGCQLMNCPGPNRLLM